MMRKTGDLACNTDKSNLKRVFSTCDDASVYITSFHDATTTHLYNDVSIRHIVISVFL